MFSNSIVLAAVDSFPQGSSSSPSGLRPSHLKEAALCPFPTHYFEFIGALTSFCQMASRGEVPADIVPFLCGATLIACLKKNGGIHPITIGEFFRRLVSKCLVSATLPEAVDCLSPHQLGVVFLVVLTMLLTSTSHHLPCMLTTLLLDFSNAFNYIDHTSLFSEIRPFLSAWFECCYGSTPVLQYLDQSLSSCSCTGVQQGDPFGPLGFALALHPIVEQLSTTIPSLCLNLWYLDDGMLVGSATNLWQAVDLIKLEGPRGVSPLISPSAYFLSFKTSISWLTPFPWRSLSLLGASLFCVPPLAPPSLFHQLSQMPSPS